MSWVRTEKAKFRKLDGTMWDEGFPQLIPFKPFLHIPPPIIMGRMLKLFGEPSICDDGFMSSREYHIEGREKWKRSGMRFSLQDVRGEYTLTIFLDCSNLNQENLRQVVYDCRFFKGQDVPKKYGEILTEFCLLILSSEKTKDFEDRLYKPSRGRSDIKYGLRDGKPFFLYPNGKLRMDETCYDSEVYLENYKYDTYSDDNN